MSDQITVVAISGAHFKEPQDRASLIADAILNWQGWASR